MATLSVMGLYQYNNKIFDGMVIPNGVDKELLINNILIECAELETLYPNDEIFKLVVDNWSAKELPTWEKLYELFNMEYNPLYNVDAYETITEERNLTYDHENTDTHNLTFKHDNNETISKTETSNNTETHNMNHNINETTTNSTSGFNSDSFQNHDKSVKSGTNSDSGTIGNVGTLNDSESIVNDGTDKNTGTLTTNGQDTDKGTITTTNRRYGNIGVTMTQQMIEREMDVRAQMNIINYIIKSFKNRFCLLIY